VQHTLALAMYQMWPRFVTVWDSTLTS